MEKQRIAIYCAAQMYPQWEKAFAAYSIVHADPAQPLTELLLKAAKSGVSLFAILDGAQKSDEEMLAAIQQYREIEGAQIPGMRIAFMAARHRETPSYLFRVLVNLDVLDIVAPPKEAGADFNGFYELAEVIAHPKSYSDIVALLAGNVINPKLIGLSSAEEMREKSRPQVRIAVAQIDQRRGGSTHTTLLLARTLVMLGYKTAVFLDSRTWKNLRRCYPRARCNVPNGLIVLSGIDFYRNEGFARINGYDYVLADFGCARWVDLNETPENKVLEESFRTAQLGVLTSVVSPLGDHTPFERVLKIWQKKNQLANLGGVKFSFFGLANEGILENWRTVAQRLNPKAELYSMPYLPDPLNYEVHEAHCPEIIQILAPVLRAKDR